MSTSSSGAFRLESECGGTGVLDSAEANIVVVGFCDGRGIGGMGSSLGMPSAMRKWLYASSHSDRCGQESLGGAERMSDAHLPPLRASHIRAACRLARLGRQSTMVPGL